MINFIANSKLLDKLPINFQDYIFDINNYFKDINHFKKIRKYLTEEQKERIEKYPVYGENLWYYKKEEYLQKYPIKNDLYFLLQDLRILKNPFYIFSINKYLDSAKDKAKIIGLLCGYWQNKAKCSECVQYYNFIEKIIKEHIKNCNRFSFWNKIRLNELFKTYLNIGKQGIINNPIEKIINNSKIINRVEKESDNIIKKQKKIHICIYKDWLPIGR